MAAKTAPSAYLYLHGFDDEDFDRYKDRLDHIFDIVNSAEDISRDEKTGDGIYRLHLEDEGDQAPAYHEARVSLLDMPGAPGKVVRIAVTHSDFGADFSIHDCILPGDEPPRTDNFDDILDLVELWIGQTKCGFTRHGHIGHQYLEEVARAQRRITRRLNALVHAYVEFPGEEKFVVAVKPQQPYAPTEFLQVIKDKRYRFLTKETADLIDELFPEIIRVHYSAAGSVTHYWLGPPAEILIEVSAETLPDEQALVKTLQLFTKIPAPHFLDTPELVEDRSS